MTNRLTGPVATRLPGFGVVVHAGRRSGRRYRTPVNVFRRGDRFVIALTYGPDAEWVRNVLASGGCLLETGGRTWRLGQPRLFRDGARGSVPAPVRLPLRLLGVADFLELRRDDRVAGGAGERRCPGGAIGRPDAPASQERR